MTNPDPINRPRRPIRTVQDPLRDWSAIDFDVEWGAHGLVLRHATCGHVVSSQHGTSANLSALVTSTLSHECPELAPVAPPEELDGFPPAHVQRPSTWQAP